MIAVHKWGMQITEDGSSDTSNDGYSSVLWRKGIVVTYNDGFFLVEAFNDDVSYDFCCFYKGRGKWTGVVQT